MPIGRGNFNKKRVSATKERKIREREAKKRQAVKEKHGRKKLAVSGQRTGMFSSWQHIRIYFIVAPLTCLTSSHYREGKEEN